MRIESSVPIESTEDVDGDYYTLVELAHYYDLDVSQVEYLIKSNRDKIRFKKLRDNNGAGRPPYIYCLREVGHLFDKFISDQEPSISVCPRGVKVKDCLSCRNLDEYIDAKTGEELYDCKSTGDLCYFCEQAL